MLGAISANLIGSPIASRLKAYLVLLFFTLQLHNINVTRSALSYAWTLQSAYRLEYKLSLDSLFNLPSSAYLLVQMFEQAAVQSTWLRVTSYLALVEEGTCMPGG